MKELKILKTIKSMLKNTKRERQYELFCKKKKALEDLERTWTEEEVSEYNQKLILSSAGWFDGTFTETDIKNSILKENASLFNAGEYIELYNKVNEKTKVYDYYRI